MTNHIVISNAMQFPFDVLKARHVRFADSPNIDGYKPDLYWISSSDESWDKVLVSVVRNGLKAIIMTSEFDSNEMRDALTLGANGYCRNPADTTTVDAIARCVQTGGYWIPESVTRNLMKSLSRSSNYKINLQSHSRLTHRETQVVNKILDGLSNDEIADEIKVSVRTVKEHVTSILRKYEAKDRVEFLLKIGKFEKI